MPHDKRRKIQKIRQKDRFQPVMAEKHYCIVIGFFCTEPFSFFSVAVFLEKFFKLSIDPVAFLSNMCVFQRRIFGPLIIIKSIGHAHPVLRAPVPGNSELLRTLDFRRKFTEPLQFFCFFSHLGKTVGSRFFGSSQRRDIAIIRRNFFHSSGKEFSFDFSLFGQAVIFIIRITMPDDQYLHIRPFLFVRILLRIHFNRIPI